MGEEVVEEEGMGTVVVLCHSFLPVSAADNLWSVGNQINVCGSDIIHDINSSCDTELMNT